MSNVDLTDKRFGLLTAKYRTNKRKGSCFLWHCECDCGKQTLVSTIDLTAKRRSSCGCQEPQPLDLTGQFFNRLKAIRPTSKRASDGSVIWECVCACGHPVFASAAKLHAGRKQSCGCLTIDIQKNRIRDMRTANIVDGTNIGMICSNKISSNNTSGVRGVCWFKRKSKWVASITLQGKHIHLGYFDTLADAADARRKAEDRIFGEFIAEHRR